MPELTVSVELPPAVTEVGAKLALAPAGRPEMLNAADSALPVTALVVTEYIAEPPDTTEADAGDAAMPKSEAAGGVNVTDTDVEWLPDVAVPVIVNVYVPAAAVPASNVSVDALPAVTVEGDSDAVAPAGAPLTLNVTDCAAPLVTAVLIVLVAELPCATVSDAGFAAIEKSLAAGAPQPGNLKEAIRVFQLNVPLAGMYSFAYQNVQSSTGSICSDE